MKVKVLIRLFEELPIHCREKSPLVRNRKCGDPNNNPKNPTKSMVISNADTLTLCLSNRKQR